MKEHWKKKVLTLVTGVAVSSVAASALKDASALETMFQPKSFENFENRHQSEEVDYTAGDGQSADLADRDHTSDQGAGQDDPEVLQMIGQEEDSLPGQDTNSSIGKAENVQTGSEEPAGNGGYVVSAAELPGTVGVIEVPGGTIPSASTGNGTGADDTQSSGTTNSGDGDSADNPDNKDNTGGSSSTPGTNPGENPTPNTPGSSDEPEDPKTPEEIWEDTQLKPNDPVVTKDGTLLGISARFLKSYYSRGEQFETGDATVTATFQKNGQTVTKELDYGGTDGYQVSLSTSVVGSQYAIFSYHGMSARSRYLVLNQHVLLNYESMYGGGYYGGDFPGKPLAQLDADAYSKLGSIFSSEYSLASVGSVANLTEAHRYMIAQLGDSEIKELFANSAAAGNSYTNIVFLTEKDGYLTTMLEGFRAVLSQKLQDDRSYVFYPMDGTYTSGRVVVNHIVEVPEGYQIRRVTEEASDLSTYSGDQVLTGYTGTDTVLDVPMGVTEICLDSSAEQVTTLRIPESVLEIDLASIREYLPNLQSVEYESSGKAYAKFRTVDGLLCSADGKTLLSVPGGLEEVAIPASVTTLGENCFAGLSKDAVMTFEGTTPPKRQGSTGFAGEIRVPESTSDLVWKSYMFAFGEECDKIAFGTSKENRDRYISMENGKYLVYRKDTTMLAAIPTEIRGLYELPDTIQTIGAGAFAGCKRQLDIHITHSDVAISEDAFGDVSKLPTNLTFFVSEEDYVAYEQVWSAVFDPVYGEGAAATLLNGNTAEFVFEDGIKYQKITEPKEPFYRVISVYEKDKKALRLKEGTKEICSGAFDGCEDLEILYLSDTVETIPEDAFSDCSALETVVCESEGLLAGSRHGAREDAELFCAGDQFESFLYEDGVLYGVYADGGKVLLNVPTDATGTIWIRENTVELHDQAVKDCNELNAVLFLDDLSIRRIGVECFAGGSTTEGLDLTTCTNLTEIGEGAFRDCPELKAADLPESVTVLPANVFYNCTGLKRVSVPGCLEVGDNAFYGCDVLATISGMDQVQKFGAHAFANCRLLEKIAIPETLTSMGEGCFENCTELKSVKLNGTLTGISRYCFYGCRRLQTVTFSDTLKGTLRLIGVQAFGACEALETVDLSDISVLTVMGERTFENCSSLSKVSFSENLKAIPDYCFEKCDNLSIVQMNGTEIPELGECAFGETLPEYIHLWVKEEEVNGYQEALQEKLDGLYGEGTAQTIIEKIDDAREYIQGVAFENTEEGRSLVSAPKSLSGVYTIPADTIRVADEAFVGCNELTGVIFQRGTTTSLGDRCFYGCEKLEDVTIYATVPEWGDETFMDCTSLEKVYIGTTDVTFDRIGVRAFKNCTGLSTEAAVTVAATVKVWDTECFAGCENLVSIALSTQTSTVIGARAGMEELGDYVFAGCKRLRVFLTSGFTGLKRIGDYAFYNCDTLKTPAVPKNVTSIGEGCFMDCDSVTAISFYCGLEEYPKDCFRNCVNLNRTGGLAVALNSLKRIGDGAYAGCSRLTSSSSWNLGKYANLEEIGAGAFAGDASLGNFALSGTVRFLGDGAFDGCSSTTMLVLQSVEPPVFGTMALDTMPEVFQIYVPDSESDGDSIYLAYREALMTHLDKDSAYRILDSASDGAKERNPLPEEPEKASEIEEIEEIEETEEISAESGKTEETEGATAEETAETTETAEPQEPDKQSDSEEVSETADAETVAAIETERLPEDSAQETPTRQQDAAMPEERENTEYDY